MNSVTKKTRLAEKRYDLNEKKALIRKQKESNKEIKQNERKQKRENLIDEDSDLGKFFELASSDKVYVIGLNPYEIKNEISIHYKGDIELNGLMFIGPIGHKTIIRFKKMNDFESYINAIDFDYDSEDVKITW